MLTRRHALTAASYAAAAQSTGGTEGSLSPTMQAGSLGVFTSQHDTLAAADAAAARAGATLLVDRDWALSADTVLKAPAVIVRGGRITCGSHRLIVEGAFWAPVHARVFAATDNGIVWLPGADQISAKWFGAQGTGNRGIDDSLPISRAVACARQNNQWCYIPNGKYHCNLRFREAVKIRGNGKHTTTERTGLFPFAAGAYVLDIGDRDVFAEGVALEDLAIHSANGGQYGLRTTNCMNGSYRQLSVMNFKTYGIVVQGSASRPDTFGDCFCRFSDVDFQNSPDPGSIGIQVRSGDGYVGPVVFDHINGQGTKEGAELLVLDNTGGQAVQVNIGGGSWLQCGGSGKGIRFTTHGNEVLRCDGLSVDSPAGTDVLIEVPANAPLFDWMVGNFTVDGKFSMPGGNSASIAGRGMSEFEHTLTYPHILGAIYFEDSAARPKDMYASGARPASALSSSGNLFLTGQDFLNLQAPTIYLDDKKGTPAKLQFAANNIVVTSGKGSPEGVVTAPVGSSYFRSDGKAGAIKYEKQTGTGNTGWIAIS